MELELEQEKKGSKLSDYLFILFKWKKFIIINMVIVLIIATTYAFLIPVEYKATTVVTVPEDNSMGLGGITSLLSGGKSAGSLGAKLFGTSSSSQDLLFGILNSRTAITDVIKKFDLMKYYKTDNMDKAIKAFRNDFSASPNENSMIEISIINESPEKSAEIANYLVTLLDSLNIKINVEQAKNNRLFVEKRYQKNLSDLRTAEDSLYRFQKKYGVFAVPEQMEIAVKAAGEIEAQLAEREMQAYFTKQQFGENSPQYQGINSQVELLKNKVNELKYSNKLSSTSNVLFPFKQAPEMAIQYLRTFREVEIQSKILEIVLPFYEQAKVEEQKSIPTVQVLDKAVPPQLKYAPKRAFVIVTISLIVLFVLIAVVYKGESAVTRAGYRNLLEEKETRFFRKVRKFYGLKY